MPGDRKSTCGARMKPIGLTYKQDGELMIIHLCLHCGKISTNRIAGDDTPYTILCMLTTACEIEKDISSRLTRHGIQVLTQEDRHDVLTILYGNTYEDSIRMM